MAEPGILTYVECPRDAWQGLPGLVPSPRKREHLRRLLAAGFRRLDLGSFVSPRAVPQLADTEEVLAGLERPADADFLCIVANERGLERALEVPAVTTLGYPLSVSDTFQLRNTRRSLEASWPLVARLAERCREEGLGLVVYLSMGFGNPYGDAWSPATTAAAVARLRKLGVERIALADTIGSASPDRLGEVLDACEEPASLGLHLHARPGRWRDQLGAALPRGVRWFEGALAGVGGCPFAADELVGNLPSERVVPWLEERGYRTGIDPSALPALAEDAADIAMRHARAEPGGETLHSRDA